MELHLWLFSNGRKLTPDFLFAKSFSQDRDAVVLLLLAGEQELQRTGRGLQEESG